MTRILIFILVLLAGVFALSLYLRRVGMFFPDRYPTGRWEVRDFMVEPTEHRFQTSDGVRLHAWLFSAKEAGAPLLVWFHGNAGNLTDRADMAVELAKRGVSVFVFDYRGFGRSEGKATESGVFRDAEAAYAYARGLGAQPIVLYGESIGGPYAAWVARKNTGIRAVVIENSFPSLRDLGNALYSPLPLGWTAPFALRTADWLNEAKVPVLVMHGKRDGVIPYRLGRKLYEQLEVEKEMLSSEGAGHCEIPIIDPGLYYEAVTRFSKASHPARGTP